MPPDDMFSFKAGVKTPEPSDTIKQFANEPVFWRGYTSDEEVASPIDADDMSFRTVSTRNCGSVAARPLSNASFPEQLAQSCDRVEQQCNRAQAITLVPAGKAKVVSMPKLVNVLATPRMRRPVPVTPIRPPVSRLKRFGIDSQASSQTSESPRTSTEKSPMSGAPTSVAALLTRGRSVRPRPSLPDLRARPRYLPDTPYSALEVRIPPTADFLQYDPYPSQAGEQATTPPPMSPSRRRLQRIGSSIGLSVFGMRRSNSADNSVGDASDIAKEPETVTPTSPEARSPQLPARAASVKPKMIARGANERAPPLILPPCPESYEDDRDGTRWLGRKDASGVMKLHKRQRSMSAALVSVQA
ncbi:hypothetical protein LTR53_010051 [Teratosphaeriaceae sp. CCFEE 6253]|nr:hypothetical protein LTR53_010051 [Teratosphaeriaceae sp. CCFEE 6253]